MYHSANWTLLPNVLCEYQDRTHNQSCVFRNTSYNNKVPASPVITWRWRTSVPRNAGNKPDYTVSQSNQLYIISADYRCVKSGLKYNTSDRNQNNRADLKWYITFNRNDSQGRRLLARSLEKGVLAGPLCDSLIRYRSWLAWPSLLYYLLCVHSLIATRPDTTQSQNPLHCIKLQPIPSLRLEWKC